MVLGVYRSVDLTSLSISCTTPLKAVAQNSSPFFQSLLIVTSFLPFHLLLKTAGSKTIFLQTCIETWSGDGSWSHNGCSCCSCRCPRKLPYLSLGCCPFLSLYIEILFTIDIKIVSETWRFSPVYLSCLVRPSFLALYMSWKSARSLLSITPHRWVADRDFWIWLPSLFTLYGL